MAVRIKDGMIPYTGGTGIEITNNHVINVLLRALNNLIYVNEDNELYVDLQLVPGIKPTDDFPVGVTTGKILQADGWLKSGLILNWKTTSGDYFRFIYATDGNLYYDPGTGVWMQLLVSGDIADILQTVNNLIDVALDNYYTKTEVDNLIGSLTSISFVVLTDVSDLPSVGDTNKIYLVPNAVDPSIYDEYIRDTTNQTWVIVGTTAVNLSNYVTTNTNQTISGTKTFTSEPVLPNKVSDATNDGTKPATEAQVYKVAQSIPTKVSDLPNDAGYITGGSIGNGKITINQGGSKKGEFTVNQSGNVTIDLDAGGGGGGGGSVSNTPYGPSWDGVTDVAPSKNAIYDKLESMSLEQDVKVWDVPQNGFTQAEMEEICLWCLGTATHTRSAILKSTASANKNLYVYGWRNVDGNNVEHYYFYGMWEKHDKNSTSQNGDFTTVYNSWYHISFDGTTYVGEHVADAEANGNYLTVENSNYTRPYIPTADYQPATKKYVDDRNWVGTQAQYDALVSGGQIVQGVIYNIISSS